jgi:hypothetical protein
MHIFLQGRGTNLVLIRPKFVPQYIDHVQRFLLLYSMTRWKFRLYIQLRMLYLQSAGLRSDLSIGSVGLSPLLEESGGVRKCCHFYRLLSSVKIELCSFAPFTLVGYSRGPCSMP